MDIVGQNPSAYEYLNPPFDAAEFGMHIKAEQAFRAKFIKHV